MVRPGATTWDRIPSPLYLNGRVPACGTGYPGSIPGSGTSASVPQWQSSGLWNRPPGFDSRQRHLCFASSQPATRPKDLLDLASQKRGTGGNRTPFSRTQAGNRTSRPQSHRWIHERPPPRQNGIRTRTNPVMLPYGIRTRIGFQFLTF